MGFLYLLLLTAVVGIVGLILFLYYRNLKFKKYFEDKGVPFVPTSVKRLFSFIFGKFTLPELEDILYAECTATGKPFAGLNDSFVGPLFYIMDLDLIRNIYVKDFDHFVNRRVFKSNKNSLLQKMLICLEGDHWKGLRSKLSPTFTTGKIKRMFNIFEKSSQRMCEYLMKAKAENGDLEICEAYSKYTMDVIASCAFGIDSKTFECPPGVASEFEEMGLKFQFKLKGTVFLKFILILMAPKVADFFGFQAFDPEPQEYFKKVIKEVMRRRRESGEKQDDFLQLMMDAQEGLLKEEENSKESIEVMMGTEESGTAGKSFSEGSTPKFTIDDEDIVANSVLFLIGGFDTTQSLLIFAAYQLALEQEVQEKVLEEVRKSFEANGGKLTYEGLLAMNYLDMVISETLRVFPPAIRTERICTKDYKIPGTDVVIEKGTIVVLPVKPVHNDPKYYENPEKFDPERFLPERKAQRHPYSYAPFGHGPRNCIGMRFALTEVKAVLASLVYHFKLEPCSRTEIPIKFGNGGNLKPSNGLWLNVSPRGEE